MNAFDGLIEKAIATHLREDLESLIKPHIVFVEDLTVWEEIA